MSKNVMFVVFVVGMLCLLGTSGLFLKSSLDKTAAAVRYDGAANELSKTIDSFSETTKLFEETSTEYAETMEECVTTLETCSLALEECITGATSEITVVPVY